MIQVLSVEDLGQLDGKYPDVLIQHIRVLLSNLQSADPSRPVSHYGAVAVLEGPADLAARGIHGNAVPRGTIGGQSFHERGNAAPDRAAAPKTFVPRQQRGRRGQLEEVGPLVVLLASAE